MRTLFLLLFNSILLFAHPHSFIDVYPDVKVENGKVEQVTIKWYMDEMTSSMLMMEFDANSDGKLDKVEIAYVRDNYFMSLKDYGFYTYLKNKQKNVNYDISKFSAVIDKKIKIAYTFTIKLKQPILKEDFKIYFYDEDFFTAFTLKQEFLSKQTKKDFIAKDYDGDYFYGYILEGKK